jgi:hypothetical protein
MLHVRLADLPAGVSRSGNRFMSSTALIDQYTASGRSAW